MNSLPITSILALGLAVNLADTSAIKADERQIVDLATSHFANIEAFMDDEDPAPTPPTRRQPLAGLQTSSLTMSSLQPSTLQPSVGTGSGGRGLTSIDEWRRMFPRKQQK